MTAPDPEEHVTFVHPELPDITFVVTRGSGGLSGFPSNWIAVTGYTDWGTEDAQKIPTGSGGWAGP